MDTLSRSQQADAVKFTIAGFVPGTCNVALLIAAILVFAQCQPPRSQWEFDVEGNCWSKRVLVDYSLFASSKPPPLYECPVVHGCLTVPIGFSAAVDIYLAVYPSFILAKLKISRANKIALGCALGIGSLWVQLHAARDT